MNALRWRAYTSLGAPAPASGMIAAWLRGVSSAPRIPLIVEMGRDAGGEYLRALSTEGILSLPGNQGTTTVRGLDLGLAPSPLSTPPGWTIAFGRLIWGRPPLPEGTPPPRRWPQETTDWCVQGLFQANEEGRLNACVRIATAGQRDIAVASRERLGFLFAEVLGAFYEPLEIFSRASQVAQDEWRCRTVLRFHSGPQDPPPVGQLASPWVAPRARSVVENGLRQWRIGVPWAGQAGGTLTDRDLLRHTCVLGMTGSGKTQFLSSLAEEASKNEVPFVLFDLEGDLGPLTVGRLTPRARARAVVIDGARPWGTGRAGVDVLGGSARDRSEDLVVAEVLSALRPLQGSKEEFWGPRMERILDSSLRAVHETEGNLADVAQLLFVPAERSEEIVKGVESDVLRGFLKGLPQLDRRQPDFLASSQNRLSHVAMSRVVRSLVAPEANAVDIERALGSGRSVVVHLPKGSMGSGPSLFVANMLLANTFLSIVRNLGQGAEDLRALLLLDEVQNFAPQLVRGILETGRKFGIATVLATQSPERLDDLPGSANLGSVGTVLMLRMAQPAAQRALNMMVERDIPTSERRELERAISTLPDHTALVREHGKVEIEAWNLPPPARADMARWEDASEASTTEFGSQEEELTSGAKDAEGRLLMMIASGSFPTGAHARVGEQVEKALSLASRRKWVETGEGGELRLTNAGWARLGAREETGAPKESDEHRRLIADAFRIFARHGVRLDIPSQGRFDVRVPDAIARILPDSDLARTSLTELGKAIHLAEGTWLWRLGRGKNVHIEAEVTSVDHPERLMRSLSKGERARAHVLFITGTSLGGRKIRDFLDGRGVGPEHATVWVLREAAFRGGFQ